MPSRTPLVRHAGTGTGPAPEPHTAAELATLLELLAGRRRPRMEAVTIGHGRDAASRGAADAFGDAWHARGGHVLAVVDWPETAASWLRPARRFCAGEPDAWVVAGAAPGWAQMSRRLRHSTAWDPDRTYGFASLGLAALVTLAGPGTLDGLRGAAADGGTWRIGGGLIVHRPNPG
ncbi:hypothetical protein [Actinomadura xylanilytica]|uniref:hypothetical protein n=1 Tax=Actinomadura xylanilytica TaxID=887459 RepID=UPI00255B33DC|nr:hypothetical protein [Actinomadura xylanilytica]MDL4770842.1 hypothetical protein [Actinomadura xylanilytica]